MGDRVVSDQLLHNLNLITSAYIVNNKFAGSYRYKINVLVMERFYENEIDNVYSSKGLELIDDLSNRSILAINNVVI
ncbi:hypothetical protein [Clostridium sp.]|uniref:hypothetical protein n=1 Tax=Clostridium sp. TaxID=1506 RepID=UPI0025C167B2|nr:hypothetical protein [Clostridium sp.]